MTESLRKLIPLFACLLAAPAMAAPEGRDLQATVAVTDATMVDVHVAVGRLHLTAGTGDDIKVEVQLNQRARADEKIRSRAAAAIAAASLKVIRQGKWICLSLEYPAEARQGEVDETWKVTVPARLGAEVEMAVGDMTVTQITGGLDLQLGLGDIDVAVPTGDVKADITVGNVTVMTAARDWHSLALRSGAGQASLVVHGKKHKARQPAGPGSRIRLDGQGEDRIDLATNVGNVILKVLEDR